VIRSPYDGSDIESGYICFRRLYFRSEYKARVSGHLRVQYNTKRKQGFLGGYRTFLDVFTQFKRIFDIILVGEISILYGGNEHGIDDREMKN